MSVLRIARRYSKALIDLAIEQNKLEAVYEDVQYFSAVAQQRDFAALLKSPIIKPEKKGKIFDAVFGNKLSETTNAFLKIVLSKGRESYLQDIAKAFVRQYKAYNKVSTIKLTTATPVTAKNLEAIKTKLLGSNATSDKVEIETAVNEDLIGGFVLELGDKLYDASVAYKLEQLKKQFADNSSIKGF